MKYHFLKFFLGIFKNGIEIALANSERNEKMLLLRKVRVRALHFENEEKNFL